MKTIGIVLLVLAILAVGLFFSQKLWMPLFGMSGENTEWNWVSSETTSEELQFTYPNPLPTKFVTAADWPPVVSMTTGAFSCTEGDVTDPEGMRRHFERRTIGGHMYCVATSAEGAAGSTFTSYEYAIEKGNSVARVSFTLRTPQCMNYDEPEQSACKTEQASFDTNALADKIASSIRAK